MQTKPHVSLSPVSVKSKKVMERERKHLVAWLRRNPHRKGAAMNQYTTVATHSHIKTPPACLLGSFWGLQLSKYATVLNFWPARCCTSSGCWRSKKARKLISFLQEPDCPSFLQVQKRTQPTLIVNILIVLNRVSGVVDRRSWDQEIVNPTEYRDREKTKTFGVWDQDKTKTFYVKEK